MNKYIENWKITAKTIHEFEVMTKAPQDKIEEIFFTYSRLAKEQLERINNTRPDKTKTLEKQDMTEEQIEFINYLLKVIEENQL